MQSNGSHLMQKLNWNINSQFYSKHFVQAESDCFGYWYSFFEHLWWMLFKMLVLYLIGKYLSILMSANMHWNYLRVFVIMQTSGSFFLLTEDESLMHLFPCATDAVNIAGQAFLHVIFFNKRNTAMQFQLSFLSVFYRVFFYMVPTHI